MRQMTARSLAALVVAGITLVLAGCSGTSSALTTSSLFGGKKQDVSAASGEVANAPAVTDPTARAVQVAWTSARAEKCGYFFDPAKLKSSLLAYEATTASSPEHLQKVERAYDLTHKTVWDKLKGNEDYCTKANNKEIKADLNRHLAGDFTPTPPKKVVEGPGFFSSKSGNEEFNREGIFDPMERRKKPSE